MTELKGFKFVTTLDLEFKKIESNDKTINDSFYSISKAERNFNESDIDDVFQSMNTTIESNVQKSLGNSSSWIIDSVIDHNIDTSKYSSLTGSSDILIYLRN